MNWEWFTKLELIHLELAVLILVVWNGLHKIYFLIFQGLKRAGFAYVPGAKIACPGCGDWTHIPSWEVVCFNCRRKSGETTD